MSCRPSTSLPEVGCSAGAVPRARDTDGEGAVGGTVWVKLPYGDFVIDDSHSSVLIAGGTGISAFTAFIEALQPGRAKPV